MIDAAHAILSHVGLAGFAGIWVVKMGLSYSLFRVWKRRRVKVVAPTE